jgi:hypothetical protein
MDEVIPQTLVILLINILEMPDAQQFLHSELDRRWVEQYRRHATAPYLGACQPNIEPRNTCQITRAWIQL